MLRRTTKDINRNEIFPGCDQVRKLDLRRRLVFVPTQKSTVTLSEVTEENLGLIFKLQVTEDQEQFVAPNTMSIAQVI